MGAGKPFISGTVAFRTGVSGCLCYATVGVCEDSPSLAACEWHVDTAFDEAGLQYTFRHAAQLLPMAYLTPDQGLPPAVQWTAAASVERAPDAA